MKRKRVNNKKNLLHSRPFGHAPATVRIRKFLAQKLKSFCGNNFPVPVGRASCRQLIPRAFKGQNFLLRAINELSALPLQPPIIL